MNMVILDSAITIDKESLDEDITTTVVDETGKLIPEKEIQPLKRFGIADLWSIRKKGRFSAFR